MSLIIFLLAQFGFTNIIIRESIFEIQREWIFAKWKYCPIIGVLKCETCFGFWAGTFFSLLLPIAENGIINAFICGLIASAFNKILLITLYKF